MRRLQPSWWTLSTLLAGGSDPIQRRSQGYLTTVSTSLGDGINLSTRWLQPGWTTASTSLALGSKGPGNPYQPLCATTSTLLCDGLNPSVRSLQPGSLPTSTLSMIGFNLSVHRSLPSWYCTPTLSHRPREESGIVFEAGHEGAATRLVSLVETFVSADQSRRSHNGIASALLPPHLTTLGPSLRVLARHIRRRRPARNRWLRNAPGLRFTQSHGAMPQPSLRPRRRYEQLDPP